jgi:HK97 family phage major capsid protein
MKEELKAIENAIVEKVQKAQDAAENASKSAEDFKGEIKSLLEQKAEAEGKAVAEVKEELEEVSAAVKALREDGNTSKLGDTIHKQLENGFKAMEQELKSEKDRGFKKSFETKAVQDMTSALAFTGDVVDNPRRSGIVSPIRRTNRVRSLITGGSMTGNAYGYTQKTGGEGTIDYTVEGAEKDQIDYDYAFVEAKVAKIAAYQKVSDEMLADVPALMSFTSNQMVQDVLDVEDVKMLYGSTATGDLKGLSSFTGITDIEADAFPTAIASASFWQALDSALAVMAGADVMVNGILMHPSDYYYALALLNKSQEVSASFLIGGDGIPRYLGIPIFLSTAVTAGDLFVADWTQAQWFQRSGLRVDISSENEDDFIKNMFTLRVEERIALALYNEKAVGFGQIADIQTALAAIS